MASFREKKTNCHYSSAYIYQWILIYLHINDGNDNIFGKFNFQVAGLKVKLTVAIFRKDFVIGLPLHLSMDFNISSHKYWILYYLEYVQLTGCCAEGKSQWIFTKLSMCIDIVEIWFGIATEYISSFFFFSQISFGSIITHQT